MLVLPFGISGTDAYAFGVAVGLLLLDFLLGCAVAEWKTHTFNVAKLPQQFETLIVLNGGGIAIFSFVQGAVSGTTPVSSAIVGIIVLWASTSTVRSLADIRAKVQILFGPTVATVVVPAPAPAPAVTPGIFGT